MILNLTIWNTLNLSFRKSKILMPKRIIKVPCPNPYCDDAGGCCLCDFSGWMEVYKDEEYEFTEESKEIMFAEYEQNLKQLLEV